MFCNPFSFKGRIRRTEFALSYLLFLVVIYTYSFVVVELNNVGYTFFIIFLAGYWFLFSQGAKRCHDMGQNSFYQLIPFYIFAMLFSEGSRQTNKYGTDPKANDLQNITLDSISNPSLNSLLDRKNIKTVGSELLSAALVATLTVVFITGIFKSYEGFSFIMETLLIMGNYFLLLLVSYNRDSLPNVPKYFVLHRALFSILLYAFIFIYNVFFVNFPDIHTYEWFGEFVYLLSIFIVTYLPYLLYIKTRKPKFIYAEA